MYVVSSAYIFQFTPAITSSKYGSSYLALDHSYCNLKLTFLKQVLKYKEHMVYYNTVKSSYKIDIDKYSVCDNVHTVHDMFCWN